MSFAKVQQSTELVASSSPQNISLPGTATAGNLLIVVVYANVATSNYSVSGFTKDKASDADTPRGIAILSKVAAGGEQTVSVVATGAGVLRANFAEFSGNASSTPFDTSAQANTTGSGISSQAVGPTGTTAVANELAVVAMGWSSGTLVGGAETFTNSFVDLGSYAGSNFDRLLAGYKLDTGAVGMVSTTIGGFSGFANTTAIIATYKPAVIATKALPFATPRTRRVLMRSTT